MDKLYFSSISNVTSFRMFYDVSLSQCINECKFRLRCDAIDYSYTRKSCFLINEPLTSNEDSRMGFVGGRKAEWDMTIYMSCTVCGYAEVCNISLDGVITCHKEECGFPPTFPYAKTLGNIYTVGSKICYECQDGYVNVGGNVNCSMCSDDGVWTAVNIQCEVPFVCDGHWVEHDGHCYLEYTVEKKWEEAQTYCREQDGYLLSIETEAENAFIKGAFPDGGYWIGGNDLALEGTYVWDSGNAILFENWDDNEPSNTYSNSDCMRSRSDWRWHDMNCLSTYDSICEKEPTNTDAGSTRRTTTTTAITTTTATLTTTTTPDICESGWLQYEYHCYWQNPSIRSWYDAQSYCRDNGGYLLSTETEAEHTFIEGAFPGGSYWIGGNDLALDGVFVWDSGNAITFENWDDGEPSSISNYPDCMLIRSGWRWHDWGCWSSFKSICEKESTNTAGSTSTTTTTIPPTTTSTTSTTTTATTTLAPRTCESGWLQYEEHCYWQGPSSRSWYDSQAICAALGAYLVSVETEHEYGFIKNNFDGDMTWLGASDATSDSVWRWESGSELTFTSWAPNEPSDCNTCNCLAVNKQWNTWLWDDKNCTNKYKNICEKDL